MKSKLKLLLIVAAFLAACKKESGGNTNLSITGFSSGAFASGDAISVYGTGFDPDPTKDVVLFNGVPGEVATASANRLQVIVPLLIADGKITVQVNNRSVVSNNTYSVVNVLQGTYSENIILTPDKKYLLRGNVLFNGKLIIQAGTVIFGEKLSHASLTASNVDFEGTAANPIVFTSDQLPGLRAPGDWTGIATNSQISPQNTVNLDPLGNLEYVRVEYAGYHPTGTFGVAWSIIADAPTTFKYLQVSYSAGDAFKIYGTGTTLAPIYMEHLVAFACWGNDFNLQTTQMDIQYALGLKDPYNADPAYGNGILANSTCVLSNFTLVGYNPAARNVPGGANALTANAGAGVICGILSNPQTAWYSPSYDGSFNEDGGFNVSLYNSVIVGSWLSGVGLSGNPYSFSNGTNWDIYEDSVLTNGFIDDNTFRHNFIVSTAPASYPFRGGPFSRCDYSSVLGFDDISTTPQLAFFAQMNDTTRVLDFNTGRDDLGIKGLADYTQLNHPNVLPASNSPLLTAAVFYPWENDNTPFIDKEITYAGAFGTMDWTASWCNFNPQQTQY